MRIIFIRHGESLANAEKRWQGQAEFPLSARGEQQVQLLGQWLSAEKIEYIYSSDLSRATQTAKEIARYHQLEVLTDQRLRETYLGRFQGLTHQQVSQLYPEIKHKEWLSSGLEDVESFEEVKERALSFIHDLQVKHAGERIVVVTHGVWIGVLLMALLHIPWQGKRYFTIENSSLTTIDFTNPDHIRLIAVNEKPHLALQT